MKKIILIFSIFLLFFIFGCKQEVTELDTVVRVIDGDTLELNSGEKVRLIGVDAPEKGKEIC